MTGKQKAFADKVIAEPTKALSKIVKEVYDVTTDGAARQIASENMTKPNIMLYLQKHSEQAEADIIELAEVSKRYAREGGHVGAAYAGTALAANRDILDRVHGKATQKIESKSQSVIIGIDLSGYADATTDNQTN